MWHAIASAGHSTVTPNWGEVERIKALHPYPKIKSFKTEQEANNWLQNNDYSKPIKVLRNYGNTIKGFTVHAHYKIIQSNLYIIYDTHDVGDLYIEDNIYSATVLERAGFKTRMLIDSLKLDNESYRSHLQAIYALYSIIGHTFDINIHIEYFSIFYALTLFSKNSGSDVSRLLSFTGSLGTGVAFSWGDSEFNE